MKVATLDTHLLPPALRTLPPPLSIVFGDFGDDQTTSVEAGGGAIPSDADLSAAEGFAPVAKGAAAPIARGSQGGPLPKGAAGGAARAPKGPYGKGGSFKKRGRWRGGKGAQARGRLAAGVAKS